MKKMRIAVLAGGKSSESEVSLKSGAKVVDGLRKRGHEVKLFNPADQLTIFLDEFKSFDIAFPVLHGKFGEDGTIQGFFELVGISYVGSGVLASAMAMDKHKARGVYQKVGLLVPSGHLYSLSNPSIDFKKLNYPVVVKPVADGSSFGVTIVGNDSELESAIEDASKYDNRVLIEEYIKGDEITVGVIGNDNPEALPVILIQPKNEFFDFEAKYNGSTNEIVPAPIKEDLAKRAQEVAVVAHKALGCRGISRTDMIIKDGQIYVLETNTMPGMTSESLLPKAAKAHGIEFEELLERLVELAMEGIDEKTPEE